MKAINLKLGQERATAGDLATPTPLALDVRQALAAVNGKATQHTYTDLHDINRLVIDAESKLESLGIPKNNRHGARFSAESGDKVPSAYKYSRTGARVVFERRKAGWFLVSIDTATIYQDGGKCTLQITAEQQDQAIAAMHKKHGSSVIPS